MWAAISVALIAYLSYRKITMAAKVLAVLLILEVAFILVLDVLIFVPRRIYRPGFQQLYACCRAGAWFWYLHYLCHQWRGWL